MRRKRRNWPTPSWSTGAEGIAAARLTMAHCSGIRPKVGGTSTLTLLSSRSAVSDLSKSTCHTSSRHVLRSPIGDGLPPWPVELRRSKILLDAPMPTSLPEPRIRSRWSSARRSLLLLHSAARRLDQVALRVAAQHGISPKSAPGTSLAPRVMQSRGASETCGLSTRTTGANAGLVNGLRGKPQRPYRGATALAQPQSSVSVPSSAARLPSLTTMATTTTSIQQ